MKSYKAFGLSEMKPISNNVEISGMHGLTQLPADKKDG
jgi:hypothetical protein